MEISKRQKVKTKKLKRKLKICRRNYVRIFIEIDIEDIGK